MIKEYKQSTINPDLYFYSDGIEDFFLTVRDGEFAIMQKDISITNFETITKKDFQAAIENCGIFPTIKGLLE